MIKEISRRCDIGENGGGPFMTITAVVADMLIDEDGVKKYLTCSWVSEAPDTFSFEVSGIELYPFYLDLDYEGDEYTVDDAKASVTETCFSADESPYSSYFRILEKMVQEKLEEEELLYDEEDFEDEEEDDE